MHKITASTNYILVRFEGKLKRFWPFLSTILSITLIPQFATLFYRLARILKPVIKKRPAPVNKAPAIRIVLSLRGSSPL